MGTFLAELRRCFTIKVLSTIKGLRAEVNTVLTLAVSKCPGQAEICPGGRV